MRKHAIAVAALAALLAGSALSQKPEAPKPAPENKKLGYFVGNWAGEGTMKPSPYGPGGKLSFSESCEWYAGGFSIVCRSQGDGPMGKMQGLSIMGYDAGEKRYVYFETNSIGEMVTAKGDVQGDTWTWTGESNFGGKRMQNRFTLKQVSKDSTSYKFETRQGQGAWTEIMTGTNKRQK